MMPVVLWTDGLIFLLVACVVAIAFYVSRHEYLRVSWRRVGENRAGIAALTVLCAFIAIGLLDSLHYRPRLENVALQNSQSDVKAETTLANPVKQSTQLTQPQYSVEVLSVFDALVMPLKIRTEKTYSAPLAIELYAKETVELADGKQARIFPRLKYGGQHLKDADKHLEDALLTGFSGVFFAVLAWLFVVILICAWLAKRQAKLSASGVYKAWLSIWRGETRFAWNALLLALGALMVLSAALIALSANYHVFGTDKVGQDILYLTLKSIRTGLVIGTITTLSMLPFAVVFGIAAGYLGGWVDDVIQYIYTTLNSIPGVLLIAAAVLMMQVVIDLHPTWFTTSAERADVRLLSLCLILGVTTWTGLCRLLRAETLKLRELDYVQAAVAFGVSPVRIMIRHIFPNVMHIVLITVVMDFSGLVLAEAVLSYVGIGVDPSTISFGTMINGARMELARDPIVWWSLAAAFIFMFALVLAANVFSDAVRDGFDPRVKLGSKPRSPKVTKIPKTPISTSQNTTRSPV